MNSRDHFDDVHGKIILKQIFKKKLGVRVWNGFMWLRTGYSYWAVENTVMNIRVP
jgi:hypothetical protein